MKPMLPTVRLNLYATAALTLPMLSAAAEPACSTVATSATAVTAETIYRLPEVPYITGKGEFEKKAHYKARVKRELDEHNRKGAESIAAIKAFKLTLPVWSTKYNAESERLVFESPYPMPHKEVFGNRSLGFSTVSVSSSTRDREGRIGNAMLGMNTSTTSHESIGIAFTSIPKTKLLRINAKNVLKLRPADAARIHEQLGVVVVGRPASPWSFSSYSSGESMIANGRVFRETYTTSYVVADFVCAYVVDRLTGSPLSAH